MDESKEGQGGFDGGSADASRHDAGAAANEGRQESSVHTHTHTHTHNASSAAAMENDAELEQADVASMSLSSPFGPPVAPPTSATGAAPRVPTVRAKELFQLKDIIGRFNARFPPPPPG